VTERLLLDTNIISETRRSKPHPPLLQLLSSRRPQDLFISALTFGELQRGVENARRSELPNARALARWVDEIETDYDGRVLSVDARIAKIWGTMSADRSRPVTDTLIAATAKAHDLTIVTRNKRDFAGLGVSVLDPWASPG
jgi:predicted nucleic acid-binding protein